MSLQHILLLLEIKLTDGIKTIYLTNKRLKEKYYKGDNYMEQNTFNIINIYKQVKEGLLAIEKTWQIYGVQIDNANNVDSTSEAMALMNLYVKYCGYLHHSGYWKDESQYLDMAYQKLLSIQGVISHEQYEKYYEMILNKKTHVDMNLGNYATAFKNLKELTFKYPTKDVYKNMYVNALRSKLNKIVRPASIVLGIVFLIWIIMSYVFDINVIPFWLLMTVWGIWLFMYVILLSIPMYAKLFLFKN